MTHNFFLVTRAERAYIQIGQQCFNLMAGSLEPSMRVEDPADSMVELLLLITTFSYPKYTRIYPKKHLTFAGNRLLAVNPKPSSCLILLSVFFLMLKINFSICSSGEFFLKEQRVKY
jgi:hypothetical protein